MSQEVTTVTLQETAPQNTGAAHRLLAVCRFFLSTCRAPVENRIMSLPSIKTRLKMSRSGIAQWYNSTTFKEIQAIDLQAAIAFRPLTQYTY